MNRTINYVDFFEIIKIVHIYYNRVFELYEDGTIDKSTLVQIIETLPKEFDIQSKHRTQIQKELKSNDSVNVSYEGVKNTLSNFQKLLEIIATEDKIILLQLIISKITIKSKNGIERIKLLFYEKVQKHFINNKKGESSDDGGSLLLFCLQLKYKIVSVHTKTNYI